MLVRRKDQRLAFVDEPAVGIESVTDIAVVVAFHVGIWHVPVRSVQPRIEERDQFRRIVALRPEIADHLEQGIQRRLVVFIEHIGEVQEQEIDSEQAEQIDVLLDDILVSRLVIAKFRLCPIVVGELPVRPLRVDLVGQGDVVLAFDGAFVAETTMPEPVEQSHVVVFPDAADFRICRESAAQGIRRDQVVVETRDLR